MTQTERRAIDRFIDHDWCGKIIAIDADHHEVVDVSLGGSFDQWFLGQTLERRNAHAFRQRRCAFLVDWHVDRLQMPSNVWLRFKVQFLVTWHAEWMHFQRMFGQIAYHEIRNQRYDANVIFQFRCQSVFAEPAVCQQFDNNGPILRQFVIQL